MRILNSDSAWETSTFSDIPSLPDSASEAIRHFCIVAGGLALILSRNRDTAIERHYAHCAELYALLGRELRKYGKTSASAELIKDVMHEVAEVADPLTMSSLKKCLEFRRRHVTSNGSSQAAQRLKQALEQARRRRNDLVLASTLQPPQSSSDGTSSL